MPREDAHRAVKRCQKRKLTGEEVLLVLRRVLEGQRTISIYNELRRCRPESLATKKHVEQVATGFVKLGPHELPPDQFQEFLLVQRQVQAQHAARRAAKKQPQPCSATFVAKQEDEENKHTSLGDGFEP